MDHHWIGNANPIHHWDSQSPPALGFLCIDYGDAPVLQIPERWRVMDVATKQDFKEADSIYIYVQA